MRTTWVVKTVTMTPGSTIAELVRVEWYRPNPDYAVAIADDEFEGDMPDEFLDCEPEEDETAEAVELGGRLTLDITDGLVLRPDDSVFVTVDLA